MPYIDAAAKREHDRAYYLANREKARTAMATWRATNSEAINAKRRNVSPEERAERNARRRDRYASDPAYRAGVLAAQATRARTETATERFRHWSTQHPGEAARSRKEWKVRNNEQVRIKGREYQKARYALDPEFARTASRRWRAAHPEQVRANSGMRRARLAGVEREPIRRAIVWARDNGICHLCNEPAEPLNWHMDHVIPISRGGPHLYGNVAVSHPACNIRKRDALIEGGAFQSH
jgi:5-methylcytosine-specific restriction endonuclease McrA